MIHYITEPQNALFIFLVCVGFVLPLHVLTGRRPRGWQPSSLDQLRMGEWFRLTWTLSDDHTAVAIIRVSSVTQNGFMLETSTGSRFFRTLAQLENLQIERWH